MTPAKAIEQLAANALKRVRDPRDWARRILYRHELGERMPEISLRYAREALYIQGREPGSDDEEVAA